MEQSDKHLVQPNNSILLEIVLVFLKRKKLILILTGFVFIISVIMYFFVFDLIYKSTATIKSSSKSSGLLGALEGNIPDIGGLDDFGIGGSKAAKELALYEEIIISRRCLESCITKFGLMERDDIIFMEDAVKDFRKEKLEISQEKVSGLMFVSVLDKDKLMAKEMTEFLLSELDKINIELSVANAKNNREFIESRYFQAKEDLAGAEDTLKSFQSIYGIAPDLQIKASAQSVFTIEAELKTEEVKLDVLKKILSVDQPEVKTQEAKVNSLRSKISEIQSSTDLTDYLRLGNSPQIFQDFLRVQREVEIQTKILTFLLPMYEQAKIEEKRDTPTIMILDKPVVAEKKVKPKRATMVVLITFLSGVFFTAIFVFEKKVLLLKKTISANISK